MKINGEAGFARTPTTRTLQMHSDFGIYFFFEENVLCD